MCISTFLMEYLLPRKPLLRTVPKNPTRLNTGQPTLQLTVDTFMTNA